MGTFVVAPSSTGLHGVALTTGAGSWAFTAWSPIIDVSEQCSLLGATIAHSNTPGLDVTQEMLLEVGTGLAGAEVTKVQFPFSVRPDTNVGFYPLPVNMFLPEPVLIAAGSRISVRVANGSATGQSYQAIRLFLDRITPDGPRDFGHRYNQAVNRAAVY